MFYSFILPCWCKCLKWLLAAASNISHFLIGISLLTHYTLNSATEKWITLILSVACTSSHHTQKGLFPMNVAVCMVAGLLCVQKQASKINLALAFLPLVMLGVPLHFISSFYCIFSSGWITHWSLDLHGLLTSSQNTLFPLRSNFVKRLYLTQQVCSLHAFKALSADISDKKKFLLSFISTNSVVFTQSRLKRGLVYPRGHH